MDCQKQIHKSHNLRSVFTTVFLLPLWICKGRDKEKFYPPLFTVHDRQRAGRWLLMLFNCSVVSDSLWLFMVGSTPGFPVHHQLLEFAQTNVQWVGDAIQPSHPLSSTSPPAFNLSQIQGLYQGMVLCIRRPKYQSFNFSISPFNDYSELISFKIEWFDLFAV